MFCDHQSLSGASTCVFTVFQVLCWFLCIISPNPPPNSRPDGYTSLPEPFSGFSSLRRSQALSLSCSEAPVGFLTLFSGELPFCPFVLDGLLAVLPTWEPTSTIAAHLCPGKSPSFLDGHKDCHYLSLPISLVSSLAFLPDPIKFQILYPVRLVYTVPLS